LPAGHGRDRLGLSFYLFITVIHACVLGRS
jgi:hypothetical protein